MQKNISYNILTSDTALLREIVSFSVLITFNNLNFTTIFFVRKVFHRKTIICKKKWIDNQNRFRCHWENTAALRACDTTTSKPGKVVFIVYLFFLEFNYIIKHYETKNHCNNFYERKALIAILL